MPHSALFIAHYRVIAMLRQDQHVDSDEAQEIIRLAARQQSSPLSDGPTVEGLAEALNLPPAEVERLLGEVRQRKARQAVPQTRQFGDRSAALSAGIVLALVVVIAVIGLGGYFLFGQQRVPPSVEGPAVIFGGSTADVGPNAEVPMKVSDGVAPEAPAAPAAPSADMAKAEADQKAAIQSAKEAVQQARSVYDYQSKSINSQDVREAQQRLQEAEEELRKLQETTSAASGG